MKVFGSIVVDLQKPYGNSTQRKVSQVPPSHRPQFPSRETGKQHPAEGSFVVDLQKLCVTGKQHPAEGFTGPCRPQTAVSNVTF